MVNFPCRLFSKLFGVLINFDGLFFFSFSKFFSSSSLESGCFEKIFFTVFFSVTSFLISFFSSFFRISFGSSVVSLFWVDGPAKLFSGSSEDGTVSFKLFSSPLKLVKVLFLLTSTETDLLLP